MTDGSQLRALIERIEAQAEIVQAAKDDLKAIYAEAKAMGYDAAIIRLVVNRRKLNPDDVQEMETLLQMYEDAVNGNA